MVRGVDGKKYNPEFNTDELPRPNKCFPFNYRHLYSGHTVSPFYFIKVVIAVYE